MDSHCLKETYTTHCLHIPDCPQARQFAQTLFFKFSLRFPICTLNLHSRSTVHDGFELSTSQASFIRAMLSLLSRQLFPSFQSDSLLYVPPERALQRVSRSSLPPDICVRSAITVGTAFQNTLGTPWEGAPTSIDHTTDLAPAHVIAGI